MSLSLTSFFGLRLEVGRWPSDISGTVGLH